MKTSLAKGLLIGGPKNFNADWGLESASSLYEAQEKIRERTFSVVIFAQTPQVPAREVAQFLSQHSPRTIQLLVATGLNDLDFIETVNTGRIFRVLKDFADPEFERHLHESFAAFDQNRQEEDLLQMTHEQTVNLKQWTEDLEQHVTKRQSDLRSSAQRLSLANTQAQMLHTSLINIYRARSIGEMEALLNRVLTQHMGLQWVRILFRSQSNLAALEQQALGSSVFVVPLSDGSETIGELHFAKAKSGSFLKAEKNFLSQIAEAVLLAIGRLAKLEQSETLKKQWEAAFDAIAVPLCLVDPQFHILKTNQAFATASGREFRALSGAHALTAFFGEALELPQPLPNVHRVVRMVQGRLRTLDIHLQKLNTRDRERELTLLMFEDITERVELERQVVESSKMAEIGTIGSSIAHELNNPLAGMLSFVQLAKMGVSSSDPVGLDLGEIEAAVRKCRDIVQNLLGFARRNRDTESARLDLRDVLQQALKITELISRSKGIHMEVETPESPAEISGRFNQLVQAICNILQNSVEAISQKMVQDPRFEGRIRTRLFEKSGTWHLEIEDNGCGIPSHIMSQIFNPLFTTKGPESNPGLGLTVAFKILSDHKGQLEITSHEGQGTTARISL